MRSINVQVTGCLVADWTAKVAPNGKPLICGKIAARRSPDQIKDGENDADFIEVTIWGQGAFDNVGKYTKGRFCTVYGKMYFNPYIDRAGNPQAGVKITADDVTFNGAQNKDGNAPKATTTVQTAPASPVQTQTANVNPTPVPTQSANPNPVPTPNVTPVPTQSVNPAPNVNPNPAPQNTPAPQVQEITPLDEDLEDFEG